MLKRLHTPKKDILRIILIIL